MRFLRNAPLWFWLAIMVIFTFFIWGMSPIFFGDEKFGEAPTPVGYIKVGEDLSYKCNNGIILWYDNYKRQSLPATPNDGRCHAS
jgi:hypothetical protein